MTPTASTAAAGLARPGIPEADRLFAPPTPDAATHALRELGWGEHITGMRIAAARGTTTTYLYSLQEAATFFLDEKSGSASLSTNGAFAWVDLEAFVAWVRQVIGDAPFADVLAQKISAQPTYNDKIEALRNVLMLRMAQYAPYTDGAQDPEG